MEENKIKRLSFFKRAKWAIFNPENYELFGAEKFGQAFSYFVIIILLFSLITGIGITYKFASSDIANMQEIKDIIPQETIEQIQIDTFKFKTCLKIWTL